MQYLKIISFLMVTLFYPRQHNEHKDNLMLPQVGYSSKSNLTSPKETLQEGDLIFQTSLSEQSEAIQLATKSKYSHCGVVFKKGNNFYIFEAVQPVKATPLKTWINRGKNGDFVVKRLLNAETLLTKENLDKLKKAAKKFDGKDYDLTFEWSDDKIYCSELIWKIYKNGIGIAISKTEKLKDFDLTHQKVLVKLKERYGNKIPMNETVVSPQTLFESNSLRLVNVN